MIACIYAHTRIQAYTQIHYEAHAQAYDEARTQTYIQALSITCRLMLGKLAAMNCPDFFARFILRQ